MTRAFAETHIDASNTPFAASDPEYDFWSEAHCLAAEQLGFAIQSRIPLTLLVGDSGAGKSTILRSVMDELASSHLLGHLDDPSRLGVFPCNTILNAFGASPEFQTKDTSASVLSRSFASARKDHGLPTLLIDNAGDFKDEDLAAVFEVAGITDRADRADGPLFKVVLCGKGDLSERLKPRFSGIIGPSIHLAHMSDEDAEDYIRHRLACADFRSLMFSDDALKIIVKYTKGNPKLINVICQAALDAFQGSKEERIEAALVRKCFVVAGYALRREREEDHTS